VVAVLLIVCKTSPFEFGDSILKSFEKTAVVWKYKGDRKRGPLSFVALGNVKLQCMQTVTGNAQQ